MRRDNDECGGECKCKVEDISDELVEFLTENVVVYDFRGNATEFKHDCLVPKEIKEELKSIYECANYEAHDAAEEMLPKRGYKEIEFNYLTYNQGPLWDSRSPRAMKLLKKNTMFVTADITVHYTVEYRD